MTKFHNIAGMPTLFQILAFFSGLKANATIRITVERTNMLCFDVSYTSQSTENVLTKS